MNNDEIRAKYHIKKHQLIMTISDFKDILKQNGEEGIVADWNNQIRLFLTDSDKMLDEARADQDKISRADERNKITEQIRLLLQMGNNLCISDVGFTLTLSHKEKGNKMRDKEKFFEKIKEDRSITPPEELMHKDYYHFKILRWRVSEYSPRGDCSECLAHYKLAKRLNRKTEKVILLVKYTGVVDNIGDIIGIELI